MPPNDGGPAFPSEGEFITESGMRDPQQGMTLRDYFAAHASDADVKVAIAIASAETSKTISRQEARYRHADVMLAAREA